ncbi:hypothetical protein [Natrarchaeobius oligotrophus]|uniref:DUF4129 domain-containing protein n=1 Tax=Natrarchaeobius chitinivorans TaxID=1679083 RepID=A0A3N6M298_NATCH|nr:hypothetical protein [Natrarchaeobius chitinivorans]RQG97508.1 hypothetical protein EA472_19310 [Natrarchaeobius chitinivorans]
MAAGPNVGRRTLAVVAVVCAICGVALVAGAMPMLASDAPANGLLSDRTDGSDRDADSPTDRESQVPAAGDDAATDGGDQFADGDGTADSAESAESDSAPDSDGQALEEPADSSPASDRTGAGPAERIAGGALYGLGTLFSGDDVDADSSAVGQKGDSLESGDVNDRVADRPAENPARNGMGGEFGELLTSDGGSDVTGSDGGSGVADSDGGESAVAGVDPGADVDDDTLADSNESTDGLHDAAGADLSDAEGDDPSDDDGPTSDEGGLHADSSDSTVHDVNDSRIDDDGPVSTDPDAGDSAVDGEPSENVDEPAGGSSGEVIDSANESADGTGEPRLETDTVDDGDESNHASETEDGDDSSTAATTEGGESAVEDALPSPSTSTVILAVLALAAIAVGYLLYARDDPIGTLRSIAGRLVSLVLTGVVAFSRALERAASALRELGSIRELPALVRAELNRLLGSDRPGGRHDGSSSRLLDADSESATAGSGSIGARERIADAFAAVVDVSTMTPARVETATPADVERSAKRAGAPDGPVETITDSFRDVEYGARDPEAYVDSTTRAHRRLRDALSDDDPRTEGNE